MNAPIEKSIKEVGIRGRGQLRDIQRAVFLATLISKLIAAAGEQWEEPLATGGRW